MKTRFLATRDICFWLLVLNPGDLYYLGYNLKKITIIIIIILVVELT